MPARARATYPRTTHDLEAMRLRLALQTTQTKLLRVRHLMRKYDPNQPRVPAGQGGGGQWSPSGGGGGAPTKTQQRTLLDGGGEVLSIRVRSGRGDWDEQHRVITPDGESRLFETEGDVQTIRDGQTGEVLSRATFAGSGTPPEATIRPVFLPVVPFVVAPAVAATLEASAFLFAYLAARGPSFGKAPELPPCATISNRMRERTTRSLGSAGSTRRPSIKSALSIARCRRRRTKRPSG